MNTNIIEELLPVPQYKKGEPSLTYPYNYQPLEKSEQVPTFFVHRHYGVLGEDLAHSLRNEALFSLDDFLEYGQPFVVFFAGAASRNVLSIKKLEALQQRILQNGGKLLVLTPAAPKHIKRQFSYSDSLTIFHDCDNEIAEAFGIHNEQNPLWQWVSGIDKEEETVPAFFVISPDKTIVYRFVDFNFSIHRNGHFSSLYFVEDMLRAIRKSSASVHPAEVYQLVS